MGYIIQNFNQKRQSCNVTHTCINFFTKNIQIIKKKKHCILQIISESIKLLEKKKVLKGGNKNAFKDFALYHMRKMSLP